MQRLLACLLLASVGLLHAAALAPQPCCMPDQLEFTLSETVGYDDQGKTGLASVLAHSAVDYKKKKMAVKEEISSEGQVFNMTVIADFATQDIYLIDEAKKTCKKSKLPSPEMTGQCLPKEAQYDGTIKYGLSPTISGDVWMMKIKDEASETDLNIYVVMQSEKCVPITESATGQMGYTRIFAGMSYFDLKDTITDPSIFDIPDYCKQDSVPIVHSLAGSPLQHYFVQKHQKL